MRTTYGLDRLQRDRGGQSEMLKKRSLPLPFFRIPNLLTPKRRRMSLFNRVQLLKD